MGNRWQLARQVQVDQIGMDRALQPSTNQPCNPRANQSRIHFDQLRAIGGHYKFDMRGAAIKTHGIQHTPQPRIERGKLPAVRRETATQNGK